MKDQKRNLNPTAPAIVAMNLWGPRYADQRGGSMDFWDGLNESDKSYCAKLAQLIKDAQMSE